MTTQDERGGGSDRHEFGQRVNSGLRILDSVNPQYGGSVGARRGRDGPARDPGQQRAFRRSNRRGQDGSQADGGRHAAQTRCGKQDVHGRDAWAPAPPRCGSGSPRARSIWRSGSAGKRAAKKGPEPERDLQLEGIGKQLTGELVTHMHAQTAIEMQYALKMAREFDLVANIEHGFDGWKMLDDIIGSRA